MESAIEPQSQCLAPNWGSSGLKRTVDISRVNLRQRRKLRDSMLEPGFDWRKFIRCYAALGAPRAS